MVTGSWFWVSTMLGRPGPHTYDRIVIITAGSGHVAVRGDLQRAGVPAGPDLGALLQMAERHFVKSFYQRDKASLMAELRPQIEKMTKGSAASR